MSQSFQRNIEDFTCEYCGYLVEGDGYTNHCPQCLYSKHVDVHPGDRLSRCGGLMDPVSCEVWSGKHSVVHRCRVCGHEKRNKMTSRDDFEKLLRIAAKQGV